jgi:hypothetical protein
MPLNRKELLTLVVLLAFLMPYSTAFALPYWPQANLRILSEYRSPPDMDRVRSHVWEVGPEALLDGIYVLRFYEEHKKRPSPLCEVMFRPHEGGHEIEWQGMGEGPRKKGSNGFLIMPGFPVPCDILPVLGEDHAGIYEEKVEAGGQIFVRRYKVSSQGIGVDEVRERGWIQNGLQEHANYTLITVIDDKGNMVVRQLWPPDGTWWIYEETPLRRSWRIP